MLKGWLLFVTKKGVKADFMGLCVNNLYNQPVFKCCCWYICFMPRPWPESGRLLSQLTVFENVAEILLPIVCLTVVKPGREDTFLSICGFLTLLLLFFSCSCCHSHICDATGAGRYGKYLEYMMRERERERERERIYKCITLQYFKEQFSYLSS